MTFFCILPSDNKNSEHELNAVPYPLYLYLSGSAFLVSFAVPNNQSFRVKLVFMSRDHPSKS